MDKLKKKNPSAPFDAAPTTTKISPEDKLRQRLKKLFKPDELKTPVEQHSCHGVQHEKQQPKKEKQQRGQSYVRPAPPPAPTQQTMANGKAKQTNGKSPRKQAKDKGKKGAVQQQQQQTDSPLNLSKNNKSPMKSTLSPSKRKAVATPKAGGAHMSSKGVQVEMNGLVKCVPKKRKLFAETATSTESSEEDSLFDCMDTDEDSDEEMTNDEVVFYNSEEAEEEDFLVDDEEDDDDDDEDYDSSSVSLSMDDDEEYTSSEDEMGDEEDEGSSIDDFASATDDEDYHLPDDVPEDLIIHHGTAQTRALSADDNVKFLTDDEESHVIELTSECTVKSISQPACYAKEALLQLNEKTRYEKSILTRSFPVVEDADTQSNASDCPQLVPIEGAKFNDCEFEDTYDDCPDDDDSSEDEEVEIDSDDISIEEEDINDKYLAMEYSSDDEPPRKIPKMTPAVIYDQNSENESPLKEEEAEGEKEMDEAEIEPLKKLAEEEIETVDIISVPITETETDSADDESEEGDLEGPEKIEAKAVDMSEAEREDEDRMEAAEIRDSEISDIQVSDSSPDLLSDDLAEVPTSATYLISDTPSVSITPLGLPLPIITAANASPSPAPPPFRSLFVNAIDSNHVLVLLKEPFYIYGTVRLTLLVGALEVYGYRARIGTQLEIFSPRGCSSVCIAASHSQSADERIKPHLALKPLEEYFAHADLEKLCTTYTPGHDAIILLRRNTERRKMINMFKKYMNENVFPNWNSIQNASRLYASEYLLHCVINRSSEKALQVSPQWDSLTLHAQSRLMLVGGKSVGKSTLLRYLLNRHLPQHKRILIIDLDIGQAELFVPQTVSCTVITQPLLGPGFFRNQKPAKAFFVGHSNIVLCAQTYMRAVNKLLAYCRAREEYQEIPWLINTMGYNKGFGLELMAVLSELLQPTDVVQLQSNKDINNFDVLLQPQALAAVPRVIYASEEFRREGSNGSGGASLEYRLHVWNAAVPQESRYQREWDMSAKDLRYATLLARLSETMQDNAEWLTDCKPLSAPLNSLKVVKLPAEGSSRDELLQAIDANLVYLCHCDDHVPDEPLECFGIGIVRGIDFHIQQVYLLPAMRYERLYGVNCLALGDMPLPTSLLTNQGPKVKNLAPYVYNTVDANASKSIKQIYHRPPEFLTGRHKNFND